MGSERTILLAFHLFVSFIFINGQIFEADDSFIEKKGNYAWLLEFYAPWCGHCKKLESTYHQVYLELKNTAVIVAKVDATKYPTLASHYDVKGYPTIKFIHGAKVITYNGERTKESLVTFAKKAYGPTVSHLEKEKDFNELLDLSSTNVIFVYIFDPELKKEEDKNYNIYASLAEKYTISSYFYSMNADALPENIIEKSLPAILVFKDGHHKVFEGHINGLGDWMNEERFNLVASVGGIGLNEMSSLNKLLFIYVNEQQDKLYDHVSKVALQTEKLNKRYQFVWLRDVDTGRNLIMSHANPPFVFVFNTSNHLYYLPTSNMLSFEDVQSFMNGVDKDLYETYGGKGIIPLLKHMLYNIVNFLLNIYKESLWLLLILVIVPSFILSFLCYILCCIDSEVIDEGEEIVSLENIHKYMYDDEFNQNDDDYSNSLKENKETEISKKQQ